MRYRGVFVFGDSLVDAGNALELAEFAEENSLAELPAGAPTSARGYYEGRFTDGFTFADLVSNKFLSIPTTTVFPFGFRDPWIGVSFQFTADPVGKNLNFAYGGAQIRQGSEVVPDLDDQTDAFVDAVNGKADPGALHMITMGGNDVRDLVPDDGIVADAATARAALASAAEEMREEVGDLIRAGARHIVVTGIPDVGMVPEYEGLADEAARRAAASQYSAMLDGMIEQHLVQVRARYPDATIHYASLVEASARIVGDLDRIFAPDDLAALHNPSDILFFDHVHPTAQAHALLAASILDAMRVGSAGERFALEATDYRLNGAVGRAGESDTITLSLAANSSYTFELLGISSGSGSLADPMLRVLGPNGSLVAVNDDGGLGLDSSLRLTTTAAGDYVIQLSGAGSLLGSYRFQAAGELQIVRNGTRFGDSLSGTGWEDRLRGFGGNDLLDGRAGADTMQGGAGNDIYAVDHAGDRAVELAGGGTDTVRASIDYRLSSQVENLALLHGAETGTGNGGANRLVGNRGGNILRGEAGADTLRGMAGDDQLIGGASSDLLEGGAGKDRFRFDSALDPRGNVDGIPDFFSADDTIVLDRTIFSRVAQNALPASAFHQGVSAQDADDRIVYNRATGSLYYDPDGAGGTSMILFARLAAGTALDALDFVIVA